MTPVVTRPHPYGILAEFEDADQLLDAARTARREGYRRMEAYSPYPIQELDDVIPGWSALPAMVLGAGIAAASSVSICSISSPPTYIPPTSAAVR